MSEVKRGRKPHTPDEKARKQVQMMIGMGLTQDQVAKIMGVSQDTLDRHYRDELDTGVDRANAQVASNLFSIATSKTQGSVPAAIFWMKTRGKWRETDRRETDAPQITIINQTIDAKRLDADSRDAFRQALLAAGQVIEHDPSEGKR